MSEAVRILLITAAVILGADIYVVFWLIISGLNQNKKKDVLKKQIVDPAFVYKEIRSSVLPDKEHNDLPANKSIKGRLENTYGKALNSVFRNTRIRSAVSLGRLGTEKSRLLLERRLIREKDNSVRLYIASALADIGNSGSIPALVSSVINSPRFYREKVNMLICDFGEQFYNCISEIRDDRFEIKELLVDFSAEYFSERTKKYLIDLVDNREEEWNKIKLSLGSEKELSCKGCIHGRSIPDKSKLLCRFHGAVAPESRCKRFKKLSSDISDETEYRRLVYRACEILARYYPWVLNDEKYLRSEDTNIKNIAVKALANYHGPENLDLLVSMIGNEETARSAQNAISMIIEKNPGYIKKIAGDFKLTNDKNVKRELAKVLSIRIEYFIMELTKKFKDESAEIIKEVLLMGKASDVINFLNVNKDIDIENRLIEILKVVIPESETLRNECADYLSERIVLKCGFVTAKETVLAKPEKKDKKLTFSLIVIFMACILIAPLLFCIRYFELFPNLAIVESLKMYAVDFNYYFAYYSLAINSIYLILLLLSYISTRKQLTLWNIKDMALLFKKKILPSVSIIAPAYNEGKTIIESTNSLLNLKYPDYELIVVNDGSKDNTLAVLIDYYNLKRVDYIYSSTVKTKPIRGVYMNRSRSKLIVVDKQNGGKADSLNAGINISNKEYFCGIDADSLLEDDSLLKLASVIVDQNTETPVLGGTILPVNGCTVEKGQIKTKRIPKNNLARLQTIEYIRAFMAGRPGWSLLNNLLIVSGAFGLFKKDRVIDVGGYLTSSGKYEKNTVGEDMEIVVRITRQMREANLKRHICYVPNANCWTEVPEDIKTLKKQRYRWHRGLIEILTFHRRMLFNPRYGSTGIIAIPYFYIFEIIGPLFEIQGYIMVLLSLMLGLLDLEIILLLFISTIFLGVLISVSSLIIADRNTKAYSLKDMLILILYAVAENFGPRQYFSFWRVSGYLNMLFKNKGWEKANRKGFSVSIAAEKAK